MLLVGFLDEETEIDQRLVSEWLLLPTLIVALIKAAWCNESRAFRRSSWVVYGFCARVAISCESVHRLNRILGLSWGFYSAKKARLFWHIVSGVGFPYVVAS